MLLCRHKVSVFIMKHDVVLEQFKIKLRDKQRATVRERGVLGRTAETIGHPKTRKDTVQVVLKLCGGCIDSQSSLLGVNV